VTKRNHSHLSPTLFYYSARGKSIESDPIDWSQETLALNAGLDRTFVGAIERAERNITLASAEKVAKAFGMTVADLLTPYRED